MKKSITLFVFTIFSSYFCFSQMNEDCKITHLIAGGGHNFQITGNQSGIMVDSLFTNLPEVKRKGYVWKFKNVYIPSLDQYVTFQVHQGVAGVESNGRGYFNTFVSEKYKAERLERKKENEKLAIIIYVKRGRNHVLKTDEEAKIVKDYLLSICG